MRFQTRWLLALFFWSAADAANPRRACDLRNYFEQMVGLHPPVRDPSTPSPIAYPGPAAHGTRLSVENGDAKLRAVRMGWNPTNSMSSSQLRDITKAMKEMKSLELWIGALAQDQKILRTEIEKLPLHVQRRIRVVPYSGEFTPTRWTQDASKPMEDGSTLMTGFAEMAAMKSQKEALQAFAKAQHFSLRQSRVAFQGGNVVVGASHVFVGSDDITSTMQRLRSTRSAAREAIATEFGRPIFEVGVPDGDAFYQPDFHIDLTMAVVRDRNSHREVILLDSPLKALETLLGPSHVGTLPLDEGSLRKIIRGGSHRRINGEEKKFETFLNTFDVDDMIKRETRLQQLASQFEHEGYEVIRVPGLNDYFDSYSSPRGRSEIYNYTNSIFSGPHALVPHMGVRVLDQAFDKIIRGLGYKPFAMPVTQKSFCLAGGIRCLSETYREH